MVLNENVINWPDVYNYLSFQLITSTTCSKCKKRSESESIQIYEEMPVPPNQSNLKCYVEQIFNGSTAVETHCQDGCKVLGQGERRTTLKSTKDSKFIILILSRAVAIPEGYKLVTNSVICTDPVQIR